MLPTIKRYLRNSLLVSLSIILIVVSAFCWSQLIIKNNLHSDQSVNISKKDSSKKLKNNLLVVTSLVVLVAQYLPMGDSE